MSRKKIREQWLDISETSNALDYLEESYRQLQRTETSKMAWKWVAIALFGALYGFAISALTGSNYERVLEPSKKRVQRLISFREALKRCQDTRRMEMTVFSQPLVLSPSQKRSIEVLQDMLRNRFEHFVPMTLAIELHGLPQLAVDVLDVIRFLALDSGNFVDLSTTQKRRVKSIVSQSKKLLKANSLYKELEEAKGNAAQ